MDQLCEIIHMVLEQNCYKPYTKNVMNTVSTSAMCEGSRILLKYIYLLQVEKLLFQIFRQGTK